MRPNNGDRTACSSAMARSVKKNEKFSEEIAKLAVYLASEDAAWVTGKVFRIDGGVWI